LLNALPSWLKWASLLDFRASLFSLLTSVYPFVDVVSSLGYSAKIAGTVIASNVFAIGFLKLQSRG
jgi:hypothetical protein